MNELVSVIIPAYNSEKYIAETIKSVINQGYKNWEMVIVDDCSTDNTKEIINHYRNIDDRIKYIKLDINSGAAVARNKALELSRGRYKAFLDADDLWDSCKLEKQLKFMIDNKYGFTFSEYEMISEDGRSMNRRVTVPKMVRYEDILKNTIIGCLTVIIDTEIIGDFRMPDVRKGQDTMTWTSILRSGHIAYGLQESLAYYRIVKNSISNNKIKALKRTWNNYRNIEKLPLIKCMYYYGFYVVNAIKKHYL